MRDFTILILPNAYASSVAVTLDVLRAAQTLAPRFNVAAPSWRIVSPDGGSVSLSGGMSVATTRMPGPRKDQSLWIIPGLGVDSADGITRRLSCDDAQRAIHAVNRHGMRGGSVAASCTGVFLLQAAGLLCERRATTSWWLGAALQRLEPSCAVDTGRMVCIDGPVVTAGAALAQTDLILQLLRSHFGTALAEAVARMLLLDARQAQSPYVVPTMLASGVALIARLAERIESAFPEPPSVANLAREFAMSTRTLSRHVQAANRRIMYICGYLTWLTAEMVEGTLKLDDKDLARSEKYQASIRQAFHSTINGVKSAAPLRSLDAMASNAVRDVVANASLFPATHHGRRDRLITRILLETGLRAGELLKLRCEDVDDRYEIKPGHIVGIIRVIRRPNDSEDERTIEPAVKTLPGPVLVSKHLAQQIKQYVVQDRRAAMDAGRRTRETPYLFVCHSGKQVGKPISRRNLNRIVSKLRKVNEVPAWLSPHTLRHTHFTELFEILSSQKVGEAEAQRIMQERGHWSPNSQMPAHYTRRATEVRQADFVEQRDALFE
jgi:transcriptional regulator GlxA family with amidase domain